ncbi:MAG: amidohydrolase [Chloroflexi bacterium]|nr:amidohydrolase [Chloroflexota bacterium]
MIGGIPVQVHGRKVLALALVVVLTFGPATLSEAAPARQAAMADTVLLNGHVATMDSSGSMQAAVAIQGDRIVAVGSNNDVRQWIGPATQVVDLGGRTVLPGLIDSHIHALRGGGTYTAELHWEPIMSIPDALQTIRDAVGSSAPGSWVQVVGGWHVSQFAERRLPTPEELTTIAPNNPVWVQYLYDRVILNQAAVAALGITSATPDPPDGKTFKDPTTGQPTGIVSGFQGITELYARVPKPTFDEQVRSTRNWFSELNRVGLTTIQDAGGAGQNWPEGYEVVNTLHDSGQLTERVRWWMQPNANGREQDVIRSFIDTVPLDSGDQWLRPMGVGERPLITVFDGDGFQPMPPEFSPAALDEWRNIVRTVAQSGWRLQIHTTRDHSAQQLLPALEEVNRQVPFADTRWYFVHLEDASLDTLQRIKALGMGISVQDRTAFWGEDVLRVGGEAVARRTPPIVTELNLGVPLGGGTDATRTATYSPFLSLWWMVTGRTLGGVQVRGPEERPSREQALRIYTMGSAWFSFDEDELGSIEAGKLADMIVVSDDYFGVPEDDIKDLSSVLTFVGGRPVYAAAEFADLVMP